MKKTKELCWGWKTIYGVMAVVIAVMLGIFVEGFSIISHAQSEGKITANSANIRKEADSNSTVVGSAAKDATVTINNQTTGADGKVWYQVFVDANTLGYIRSDLVQITDGSTPPTQTETTEQTPATSAPVEETMVVVDAVNPISASVTGGEVVRVRGNASTTSQIITTVQSGMALTVTGSANGTDGNVWYQVTFIDNGATVTGFIRSEYVTLSGELTPVTGDEPTTEPTEETAPEEVVETKRYETKYTNDKWYLVDNELAGQYVIDDMFTAVETNKKLYEEEQKKVKSQKAAIIILVVIMIAMLSAIAYLVFKIKDVMDSAYFSAVEKETLQRRDEIKSQRSGQRVMHTVGAENKQAARPAGAASTQGTRPTGGARPTGAAPTQGTRPSGQARPAGVTPTQGTRPSGQARPTQGTRPTGQARPAGATPVQGSSPANQARPAEGASAPMQQTAPTRPVTSNPAKVNDVQNKAWKSKNFMQDDDEFEFEFLNWDGEEEI